MLKDVNYIPWKALKGEYCTFRTTYSFSITLLYHLLSTCIAIYRYILLVGIKHYYHHHDHQNNNPESSQGSPTYMGWGAWPPVLVLFIILNLTKWVFFWQPTTIIIFSMTIIIILRWVFVCHPTWVLTASQRRNFHLLLSGDILVIVSIICPISIIVIVIIRCSRFPLRSSNKRRLFLP